MHRARDPSTRSGNSRRCRAARRRPRHLRRKTAPPKRTTRPAPRTACGLPWKSGRKEPERPSECLTVRDGNQPCRPTLDKGRSATPLRHTSRRRCKNWTVPTVKPMSPLESTFCTPRFRFSSAPTFRRCGAASSTRCRSISAIGAIRAASTVTSTRGRRARKRCRSRPSIEVVAFLRRSPAVTTVDLTGGAPELNPHFRHLVLAARGLGRRVIDRCNLTILEEPGQEELAAFLAANAVDVVASLPCYLEENVDRQRGKGVFEASLRGLQRLNALGYGAPDGSLVRGPRLQPARTVPSAAAGRARGGLQASPVRSLRRRLQPPSHARQHAHPALRQHAREQGAVQCLHADCCATRTAMHNLERVMCRGLVSVDWQGYVYDCDFNQMLGTAARRARPSARPHLRDVAATAIDGTAHPRRAITASAAPRARDRAAAARSPVPERRDPGHHDAAPARHAMGGAVAAILAVAAFFALDLGRFLSLDYVKSQRDHLEAWRNAQPLLAAAITFVIYVAVTALSLPGAAVMTLAGRDLRPLLGHGDRVVRLEHRRDARVPRLALPVARRGAGAVRRRAARDRTQASRSDGAFYLFTLRLVPVVPVLRHQPADGPRRRSAPGRSTG